MIEVLAALIILCLLTMTVLTVFVPAAVWTVNARMETQASHYAAQILENARCRTANLDNPDVIGQHTVAQFGQLLGLTLELPDEKMQANVIVEPYETLYRITVIVKWNEGSAARSLTTMVRRE